MKALLDTNIVIHREARNISNQDIGILFKWLDKAKYQKCIHQVTIDEINKNTNKDTVDTFNIKLDSYEQLVTSAPMAPEVQILSVKFDKNDNDRIDTALLNELFNDRVDILISEDGGIHTKAKELNLSNRVFKISSFLETVVSQHPELIDYKVLSVTKKRFGELNLDDSFFDSFKEDYPGFKKWFNSKANEPAYVTLNDGKILSFLYLKAEGTDESYNDINPVFTAKRRIKIGTFKVVSNGLKLGERFLKIVFDNAILNKVDEIYLTIFNHRDEHKRLIDLIEVWGFVYWGMKGNEHVYVRQFTPAFDFSNLKKTYPFISERNGIFIVPIYEDYHTELLPDSILNTESPLDFVEAYPHRNAITKVYVSRAIKPHPNKGDVLVFYRTGGYYKSVVTTIAIVEEVIYNIASETEFINHCRKGSVFPENELKAMWNYKSSKPFVIRFLYVYSFPHRINMKQLIDFGILQGVDDAPRGFKPISSDQFQIILKQTKSNESFIID